MWEGGGTGARRGRVQNHIVTWTHRPNVPSTHLFVSVLRHADMLTRNSTVLVPPRVPLLLQIIDGTILCVHGGLSPEIRTLDQIRVIARAQEIPHEGAFCGESL